MREINRLPLHPFAATLYRLVEFNMCFGWLTSPEIVVYSLQLSGNCRLMTWTDDEQALAA